MYKHVTTITIGATIQSATTIPQQLHIQTATPPQKEIGGTSGPGAQILAEEILRATGGTKMTPVNSPMQDAPHMFHMDSCYICEVMLNHIAPLTTLARINGIIWINLHGNALHPLPSPPRGHTTPSPTNHSHHRGRRTRECPFGR